MRRQWYSSVNITDPLIVRCRVRANTASSCNSTFSMQSLFSISAEPEVIDSQPPVTDPIERFRTQYGDVAGLLRERDMYDPHPSLNHAWVAARLVNRYGLYEPCVSFEVDYANAVAEWEAQDRIAKEAEERKRAAAREWDLRTQAHVEMWKACPWDGIHYIDPPKPKTWAESAKDAEELATKASLAIAERFLAIERGRRAASGIIAAYHKPSNDTSPRGRRLFQEALVRDTLRERDAMMVDYLADSEDEDGFSTPRLTRSTTPEEREAIFNPWAEELPDPECFEGIEGTFNVENGAPMVKRGSFARLLAYVTG